MSLYYVASEENVNYLAHHGVRGMKWGTRKNRSAYNVASRHGYNRMGIGESFKNPVWRLKSTRDAEIKKEYVKRGGKAGDYEKVRADSMRRRGKARFIGGLATAGASGAASLIGTHLISKSKKLSDAQKEVAINGLLNVAGKTAALGGGVAATGAVMNRVGNRSLKNLGALNDKKKRR